MLIRAGELLFETDAAQLITKSDPHPQTGQSRSFVVFADGRQKHVEIAFEDLSRSVCPILPAPAGYVVLRVIEPGEVGPDRALEQSAVLAFRIGSDAVPWPITAEGDVQGHEWALLSPNGRCATPDGQKYPDADAFLKASCALEGPLP